MLVKDAQGKLLYHEFAHAARAGWNNISFSFDERQPYSQEEFKEFMEPLSKYLSASYLLLSTQDGEVRTERVSEADKYSYEKLVKNL